MFESDLTGKRVVLIRMEDPYTKLRPGMKGTIRGVDGIGNILVNWDNGSTLSLVPEVDEYKIMESKNIRSFLEFVNSDTYIDSKLKELEDMVKSFTEGKDLMYHWENKNDEAVVVTFQFDGVAIKYDFDVDEGILIKTSDDEIDFQADVESVEEGLDIIEKDIQQLLDISERKKAAKYKGRKIPGKYLSGPHPGKMKKEIDTFRGKDVYKKDWDADYKSGKGGKGERVKTKKSAATKAYQKMFGKNESLNEDDLLQLFYYIDGLDKEFSKQCSECCRD